MKIAIVIAGAIIVVVAALVAIRPGFLKPASLASVTKSDIFGFSPGMTFEETTRLVTQRRYRCRQMRESHRLDCAVDNARVTIDSDEAAASHPIWRVTAELNDPPSPESAVKSISDQFNASPTLNGREEWIWIVGRGLRLSYDGHVLKLVDEAAEARQGTKGSLR